MIKRKIDILLSEGHGKQLAWLLIIAIVCIFIAVFIARYMFDDNTLQWQDVVGLFLDPGVFGSFSGKGHDFFRLCLALLSVFLFSALLVSVFTNVFENISVSVREGHRRYKLKNHVVILGNGYRAAGIIEAFRNTKRTVVIMSENKPDIDGKYIFYNGRRNVKEDLISANVDTADVIYILGEENESNHDACNLQSLDLLSELCATAKHDIHCFITVRDFSTTEVFHYLKSNQSGRLLLVDVINEYEYEAEQLLVNTDFLPIIKDESIYSQVVILGTGPIAQAISNTVAHLSHYPNYRTKGLKSCITFIGEGMKEWKDNLIASRPGLFELSEYVYISYDGKEERFIPQKTNDFLDIRWEFIDSYAVSSLSTSYLRKMALDKSAKMTIFVCEDNPQKAISTVLHLPCEVFGINAQKDINYKYGAYNIAVYLKESTNLIDRANTSDMFGRITVFGNIKSDDLLLSKRSRFGKRVNYVYDKAYGNPPSKNEEEAWYKIPEAHKYSSIYCANAMFLRQKCFDMNADRLPIYEAEHRRWMMSELLMGYRTGEKTDRSHFIHEDIIPFEQLTSGEQEKDKILIDAIDEILADKFVS